MSQIPSLHSTELKIESSESLMGDLEHANTYQKLMAVQSLTFEIADRSPPPPSINLISSPLASFFKLEHNCFIIN
jgi:hypothetical protein